MASKKPRYHQRPDGRYECSRTINGKRKTFYGKTIREVERKMLEYREDQKRGRSFTDVAEEWETVHFPTLAPNTLKGYKPASRRAQEYFGNKPLRQIKAPDIKRFIVSFARTGLAQRAQKTVQNQLLVVNLIMGYAAEIGEIEYNPCANVTLPRDLKKTHRDAASAADEEAVKMSSDTWLLPYLILYTGLRKGEALALTYGDIDRANGVIHVTKSVYHENNKPHIKRPKTEAGIRDVPILDPLAEMLPKKYGASRKYLFSDDGGETPLTEMQYQKHWKEYVEATGIECTAHQLRHSFATMLFECGIEVKDAQDILGHSTAAMTQDVYTHIRDSRRKDTAQKLNQRLREQTTKQLETVKSS